MASAILLLALVLIAPRPALATEEGDFLGILKRFGITTDATSKKPCLCNGGILDRRVGTVTMIQFGGNYVFECTVPSFNASGDQIGNAGCEVNGGSTLVISK